MQTLLLTLTAACATLVLHEAGLSFTLYWSYWWFDLVVHAVGGLSIGLFATYFFASRRLAACVALSVIVCWEIFEVFIVHVPIVDESLYVIDTITDVMIGMAGASAAWLFVRRARG